MRTKRGVLVTSLDVELAWGMHGVADVHGAYRSTLLGGRDAVPRILERFARVGLAATWATVGALFTSGREEFLAHAPSIKPRPVPPLVDLYAVTLGRSERNDPLHFAPSLVREIASAPRQEIGSHAYAHFTAMEPGHDLAAFEADLDAAVRVANAQGVRLRSYVWPRHQVRREWLSALAERGFRAHRGPPGHALYAPAPGRQGGLARRAARLLDAYLPMTGTPTHARAGTPQEHGLVDVPESHFLRPALPLAVAEPLRAARIVASMRDAARRGRMVHVWWHPHNFGRDLEANLRMLDAILTAYVDLRDTFGLRSLTMIDAARLARSQSTSPADAPTRAWSAGGRTPASASR